MKVSVEELQKVSYGRLIILREVDPIQYKSGNLSRRFLCKCDCGNEKIVQMSSLRNGMTKSCGCYNTELTILKNTSHNLSKHPLYLVWKSMKRRCSSPKAEFYARYGGRGISVCEQWINSFQAFYDWCLTNGYEKGLQIDRINNDGNYEPDNCRFVTRTENIRNCSQTKIDFATAQDIRNAKLLIPELSDKEIALAYSISKSNVNQILLNKTWN